MSHDTPLPEPKVVRGGGRLLVGAGLAGLLGLLGFAVGFAVEDTRRQALFSYLAAFSFALSVCLGALVFLTLNYIMGSVWPVVIRRLTETVAASVAVLALLFLPVALGLSSIYEWANEGLVRGEHSHRLIEHRHAYLNSGAFLIRAAVYFAIWIGVAFLLRRASLRRDADPKAPTAPYALSALGLPAVAFALTFASFDWIMGLDMRWSSTMFGVYYFAGGFLGAIATIIILAERVEREGALAGLLRGNHYHALGRLLLGFTIFWAYIGYAQGFLVYIANKPEEVPWFIVRASEGWKPLGLTMIVGHFVVPFALLLSRALKFNAARLSAVAWWILAMHYVDHYWMVAPSLHEEGFRPHWLDLAALVGVGGAVVAFGTWLLRGGLAAPKNDPGYAASLRYHSL
jgi:hypothetical protein